MKRTFVCASSCIKHYVQPSYGCRGTAAPVVARMCVYTARKNDLIHNLITKKYWNKNEKKEQKIGMLLQKRTDTRVIHTLNLWKVQSMDDNCGEWVECMGVASGCGEQEVGVASGSGWNLWVWLLGVVVRRYIDFLILLIPTPLVSVLFYSSIPTFCSFFKCFSFLFQYFFVIIFYVLNNFSRSLNTHTSNYWCPTAAI